jgi:hypothetical protein
MTSRRIDLPSKPLSPGAIPAGRPDIQFKNRCRFGEVEGTK